MGCNTFNRLVALLADDQIFQSQGKKPQRHVKIQLAAFFTRYGQRASLAFHVGRNLDIGDGTIYDYCQRVTKALCKLRHDFLGWPNETRKDEISNFIEEKSGFHLCIGSGDGSLIRFAEALILHGDQYRCRKKIWAVINIICSVY
jgi:hypothetical protein